MLHDMPTDETGDEINLKTAEVKYRKKDAQNRNHSIKREALNTHCL